MKPAYKIEQRIKVIPHFNQEHKRYLSDTYDVWDTGIIEEIDTNCLHNCDDHYDYGIRFDHDNRVHYALESMIIPEDHEYTTDNFITNPKVKRVIGRSATTLLCVCEDDGADHVLEHTFLNY